MSVELPNLPIVFRPADPSDLFQLANTYHQSWHTTYQAILPKRQLELTPVSWFQKSIVNYFTSHDASKAMFVACIDKHIVGFIKMGELSSETAMNDQHSPAGPTQELHQIYLHPHIQRQNIGAGLMKAGFEHALACGAQSVRLQTDLTNQISQPFYQYMGGKCLGQIMVTDERYNHDGNMESFDNPVVVYDFSDLPASINKCNQQLHKLGQGLALPTVYMAKLAYLKNNGR